MKHGPKKITEVKKKRTFYWLDGSKQVLEGDSVADAFIKGGYSAGALHALDFVADGEDDNYIWRDHHWVRKVKTQ